MGTTCANTDDHAGAASPAHWREQASDLGRVRAYLDGGRAQGLDDVLLLTTAVYRRDCGANDRDHHEDEIFDWDEDEEAPSGEFEAWMPLAVFARLRDDLLEGRVEGWLAAVVADQELDQVQVAVLCTAIAIASGLVSRRFRSVRRMQRVLASDDLGRLHVIARVRRNGRLVRSGLVATDRDPDVASRFISAGPVLVRHLGGDEEDEGQDEDDDVRLPGPAGHRRRKPEAEARFVPRRPRVRFDQLVLPPAVARRVEVAIAQVGGGERLFDEWGLGEVIAYGRGTTMLLAGPPGVGKTAAAEAIADALGREILEVAYPSVQAPLVGQCERAIAEAFETARRSDSVLFWDEIDGLIHDRAVAGDRPWVVSQVTTFLRELEAFEGVCILATNRFHGLDPAIDRRLAFKIAFPEPGIAERRRLWTKLLPDSLPLDDEVDLEELCARRLTGAQITNVVLNAARLAVADGGEGARVTRAMLEECLAWEEDAADDRANQGGGPAARQPTTEGGGRAIAERVDPAATAVAVDLPSLRVNTRAISDLGRVALAATGTDLAKDILLMCMGRRFVTRNGSLVQAVVLPGGEKRPDRLGLAVIDGGHGLERLRGHARGSVYVVEADGSFAAEDAGPDAAGMDVVAEVVED